jgi:hypothetical protein
MDRSIPIRLLRRALDEPMERLRTGAVERESAAIRSDLAQRAAENMDKLTASVPEIPDELNDRAADICLPLLAIAYFVGWSDPAREAAVRLSGAEDEADPGVQLLADIDAVFLDRAGKGRSSRSYRRRHGSQAPSFSGHSGRSKTRRSRTTGCSSPPTALPDSRHSEIAPKPIWIGAGPTPRGYEWTSFEDAWRRYVATP